VKRDLAALAGREHDLLVVGGGIYGAATAWDAAQRGLQVGLVEAVDFGAGTSWNSLKTIHGGLRHLQRADVAGLRESARERSALLRMAPALVRPLPFLVPAYGHGRRGREVLAAGLLANELLTLDRNRGVPSEVRLPRSRVLSRAEVLSRVPGLDPSGLSGGGLWHDAQVSSSERLLVGLLEAASSAGAALANYAPVIALSRDGARVRGAVVRDLQTGTEAVVRARVVVNTTGPDVGTLLRWAAIERPQVPLLHAANLVLRRRVVSGQAVGSQSEGRYLFLVPWLDRSIVGTEYRADGPVDVEAFFELTRRAFPWAGLDRADVSVVHRGRVPGISASALWTRSRVIDHEVEDRVPGLITLVSAKYTTARAAAERAVDLACRRLGKTTAARTAWTPLHAARPVEGSLADGAHRAVERESALHLTDAVLRRLDLGTGGAPSGPEVTTVLSTMAALLGWDEARQREERRALQAACAPPFAAPAG